MDHQFILKVLESLDHASTKAMQVEDGPEAAIQPLIDTYFELLGDRQAHLQPDALKPGERQFFVSGLFVLTPDERFHMLVANKGFPEEQQRLMVPANAGHPGQVYKSKAKLLLKNTDEHQSFRQYLKTARMGSAMFVPLLWEGRYFGQVIMAAQARYTMRESDHLLLSLFANQVATVWVAKGGLVWAKKEYPPSNAFYVSEEGM